MGGRRISPEPFHQIFQSQIPDPPDEFALPGGKQDLCRLSCLLALADPQSQLHLYLAAPGCGGLQGRGVALAQQDEAGDLDRTSVRSILQRFQKRLGPFALAGLICRPEPGSDLFPAISRRRALQTLDRSKALRQGRRRETRRAREIAETDRLFAPRGKELAGCFQDFGVREDLAAWHGPSLREAEGAFKPFPVTLLRRFCKGPCPHGPIHPRAHSQHGRHGP